MTALCNQPEAFASDLGDDQSLYFLGKKITRKTCQPRFSWKVTIKRYECVCVFICRRAFVTADTWWAWFRVNSIFLVDALVLVLAGLAVVPLTFTHIYVAAVNLTTWELLSSHRISYLRHLNDENPFHRGYLRNIATFCCICRPQNWGHVYRRYTEQLSDSAA